MSSPVELREKDNIKTGYKFNTCGLEEDTKRQKLISNW